MRMQRRVTKEREKREKDDVEDDNPIVIAALPDDNQRAIAKLGPARKSEAPLPNLESLWIPSTACPVHAKSANYFDKV